MLIRYLENRSANQIAFPSLGASLSFRVVALPPYSTISAHPLLCHDRGYQMNNLLACFGFVVPMAYDTNNGHAHITTAVLVAEISGVTHPLLNMNNEIIIMAGRRQFNKFNIVPSSSDFL